MAKTCVKVVGRIIFIELGLGINALITEKVHVTKRHLLVQSQQWKQQNNV